MKNFLLLTAILLLASCNSKTEETNKVKTMNPNDIRVGPVRHSSLSEEQTTKIKRIHSTFEEVYPISLEETINNFKRDMHPDKEIAIWLQMADAYEKYLKNKQGKADLQTKKEAFGILLSRTMMPSDEVIANSTLTFLSEKEARELLSYYDSDPDPIDVVNMPE